MNKTLLDAATLAAKALQNGQTILYPTDTIWGIGCDATNSDAVEKIYDIKQRDHSKSMLILCANLEMVSAIVCPVDDALTSLFLSQRPTTVIVPTQSHLLATNLLASDGTIGIRIPQSPFCQLLFTVFDRPIVSTSANISGQPSPASYNDIGDVVFHRVDHCLPPWTEDANSAHRSSRIVKLCSDGSISVIRQ